MLSQSGKFGSACRFSHDQSSSEHQDRGSAQRDRKADETPGEQRARSSYNSWRSLIRRLPQANDLYAMQSLWDGALDICTSGIVLGPGLASYS
jgi:hypothetical protein